mmetsp:Transcript_46960/g.111793  ORF Transcript_46960/g.111793 Transcript_46960/m.111793 type:complete len:219 (-) Transcript_46960:97-753(-)
MANHFSTSASLLLSFACSHPSGASAEPRLANRAPAGACTIPKDDASSSKGSAGSSSQIGLSFLSFSAGPKILLITPVSHGSAGRFLANKDSASTSLRSNSALRAALGLIASAAHRCPKVRASSAPSGPAKPRSAAGAAPSRLACSCFISSTSLKYKCTVSSGNGSTSPLPGGLLPSSEATSTTSSTSMTRPLRAATRSRQLASSGTAEPEDNAPLFSI